ncbi:MAG: hypothetical protein GAK43_01772 [Stenotrophomonas maltophilia]|nr:MAG: hypothetical protein GAK43_01772 [Stenotrophomonas maltophilia]
MAGGEFGVENVARILHGHALALWQAWLRLPGVLLGQRGDQLQCGGLGVQAADGGVHGEGQQVGRAGQRVGMAAVLAVEEDFRAIGFQQAACTFIEQPFQQCAGHVDGDPAKLAGHLPLQGLLLSCVAQHHPAAPVQRAAPLAGGTQAQLAGEHDLQRQAAGLLGVVVSERTSEGVLPPRQADAVSDAVMVGPAMTQAGVEGIACVAGFAVGEQAGGAVGAMGERLESAGRHGLFP